MIKKKKVVKKQPKKKINMKKINPNSNEIAHLETCLSLTERCVKGDTDLDQMFAGQAAKIKAQIAKLK